MGAELMNDASAQADGEMIAMLIESLLAAGLTEFQISVGNVEYFKGICEYLGMDKAVETALRDEISGRTISRRRTSSKMKDLRNRTGIFS